MIVVAFLIIVVMIVNLIKECQIPLGEQFKPKFKKLGLKVYKPSNKQFFICKKIFKNTGYTAGVNANICAQCERDDKVLAKLCALTTEHHKKKKQLPYQQLSIVEMGKNFAKAMKRAAKTGFKKIDKRTYIERQMCCTTCRATKRCPYCGCFRKSKAWLASEEGCPNPQTYPNLRTFPPRNYWAVCDEMTSVIIPARNEPYLNRTIENLFTNATGKIEIIAILDGCEYDIIKDKRVEVIKHKTPLGRRVSINEAAQIAQGQYLFNIDAHCTMDAGWDTKLKCACDDRSIAVAIIKRLNLNTWQIYKDSIPHAFVYLNQNFYEKWWSNYKPQRSWKVIEETMAFIGLAWMIKKKYFEQLGGYDDLELGKYGFDGPEWSLKIWLHPQCPGRVLLRTDVTCGHLFHSDKGKEFSSEGKEPSMPFSQWRQKVLNRYGDRVYELIEKFAPVPEWD